MKLLDEKIAGALPPGCLFAVGGRVRDELRQASEGVAVPYKDLDYVVRGVSFAELRRRLGSLGRVDLVGASFAVLKVTIEGATVDVALPRRERSLGVGHREFEIESGPDIPITDDLARRDFRMNMIARALPGGELLDPYGGEADIRARRIDIVTPEAFQEDPLRMLRAAQFAARFGYEVTPSTKAAMGEAASLVASVSPERIGEELTKLFERAPKPSVGLEILRETGLLEHLWPELLEGVGVHQNEWHAFDVYRHTLETVDATRAGDLTLRLAALFHDVGKPRVKDGPHFYRHEHVGEGLVRSMLGRFRFSNEIVDGVAHLVRQHMYSAEPDLTDAAIRRFIRRIGPAYLERQFALRAADVVGSGLPKRGDGNERFQQRVWDEVARKPAFSLKDVRITGSHIVEAMVGHGLAEPGFRGDERVGAALDWLFEKVTDRPDLNEPNTLQGLLDAYLTNKPEK
ncbi:MAG: CCA tRNA nucleotidyltransferase [Candidatus Baltobacteraceae bacterium]